MEQLHEVVARPKVTSRISAHHLAQLVHVIERNATLVMIETPPPICRDSSDDAFLECARLADCDFLVSGDNDLLVLKEHGRTQIINPAQFLAVWHAMP